MNTFRCSIVTPEQAVFDDEAKYVSFPAWDGQLGVMSGQSPLLTQLGIGSMRVDLPDGEKRWYLVEGGFAQVHGDVLTVLTERATRDTDLDTSTIHEALADANARAVAGGATDRRRAEADQQRARAAKTMASASRGR